MTTTDVPPAPVLSFTTSKSAKARPTLTFELDGREVTATAPKAARWARMWGAGASGNSQLMCYEWLKFIDVSLGEDVARWIKDREDDPDDPFDIQDLIELIKFLNREFEPLLRGEFEDAGVGWQEATVAPAAAPNRAARRSSAKTGGTKKGAAKKTAAKLR